MKKLTKMQQKVYDYIAQFMTKWGYPPSVREICAELNFKSPSTAHFHILNLEKKGYLEHDAGKGRAIRLKGEAQTAPAVPAAPAAPSNAVDFMEERDARENRIPIVGNVAAGSPILAQECVEDYLTFDTGSRSGEFFALRVRGESMLGVGILPDELVGVRRQQTANNGEIVVALIGDEATVKTFKKQNGEIWLLPANPDYQPIDGRECEVLGKGVAVVRQYCAGNRPCILKKRSTTESRSRNAFLLLGETLRSPRRRGGSSNPRSRKTDRKPLGSCRPRDRMA